ncbi:EF-hand domain-containing protein 1-like isoform X2 [Paralichthys olivaceus]|uniref:EF-hand domain-containing protein 1-like isoform X2 n=1 Tax=Paralichthys olivaceus TaxID=8255 RepID=UPI0037539D22
MSWNNNSHRLPFLPGYTFQDITKTAFHRSQNLTFKNGFPQLRTPPVGIGQDPLLSEQVIQQEINKRTFKTPDMTHGSSYKSPRKQFVPAYVTLDKKVLRFNAYFKEDVQFSPDEVYRVSPVMIYYYLEDDSMCIYEPIVENSGLWQGKWLKRQRVPKNERGEHYEYKDLNLGIDLVVYVRKYHITNCDEFTMKFMESEGIILNDPEPMPVDPYINNRKMTLPCYTTPSEFDKKHRFLTMDGKKTAFHRSQNLTFKNGFLRPRIPPVGIGQDPLLSEQVIQQEINKQTFKTPDMTHGSSYKSLRKQFVPAYVTLDKKVLRFYAYFKEDVQFSRDEVYRVRPVIIYYYLEDDSMCIYEPIVENSGLWQGKRLKRQRVPKNERGEHYEYKDLNLGIDLVVYVRKYHITNCDEFTMKFMESEGIILNDPEPMPVDPYINNRKMTLPCYTTPSEFDKKHRFLTMDGKKTAFHRSQNLTFKNGFLRLRTPPVGIGQDPLLSEQVIQQEINKRTFKTPVVS